MTEDNNTKHKMKTHTKIAMVAGAVLIAGGVSFAAVKGYAGGYGHHGKMHGYGIDMFERVDADNDGKITKAEATAYLSSIRSQNDSDGNGAINLSEFEGIFLSQVRPMMVDKFQMLDDDGDGEISEAEVTKRMDRMMRWADRNDDGAIELREIKRKHRWHHDDDDDDDDDDDYRKKDHG